MDHTLKISIAYLNKFTSQLEVDLIKIECQSKKNLLHVLNLVIARPGRNSIQT